MLLDSKRPFYFIAGFLILALSAMVFYSEYQKVADENSITIITGAGAMKIRAEFAKTPDQLAKGLMNRTSLPADTGMLFIFPDEKPRSFWMKDTLIPLDLLFISSTGRVNEMTTMQPCNENPCPSYESKTPAKYVLEINSGAAAKRNIIEGDILEIENF